MAGNKTDIEKLKELNFKDRQAELKNRKALKIINQGTDSMTVDMSYADNPTVNGTELNAATMSTLKGAILEIDKSTATNKTAIEASTTDIAANKTAIEENKTDIATNKTDIAKNRTDIAANAEAIETNKKNIAAQERDLLRVTRDAPDGWNTLLSLGKRIQNTDARLDSRTDYLVELINSKVEQIHNRVDGLSGRASEMDYRLRKLSARVGALESGAKACYGVQIDTTNPNPESAVTYTDSAAGFVPSRGNDGNYLVGDIEDCYPWNAIKPCLLKDGAVVGYLNRNDFSKFEDGTDADIASGDAGDVMIEIPHFWYQIKHTGRFLEVKVSGIERPGFTDWAFSYKGNVKERFYVAGYTGNVKDGKLRSISGVMPTADKTIGEFRTAAQANGAGYEQLSFNKLTALQVLYLLQFKNLNSQEALGKGWTNVSEYGTTGLTDKKGMCYGSTSETEKIKFNGIEDFWGNFHQRVDGYKAGEIGIDAILVTDGNYDDTGVDYKSFPTSSVEDDGFVKDVVGNNALAFTPKDLSGNSSTYYSDYGYLGAGYLPVFGGDCSSGANAGAFCLYVSYSASVADSRVGARLVYNG